MKQFLLFTFAHEKPKAQKSYIRDLNPHIG